MHIKSTLSAVITSAALMSGASAAVAGGFVAPVVDVEPVVVAPAMSADWAGAYAGGSFGYSFGGDDTLGFNTTDDDSSGLGSVDVKGATAGVHVGYRWQRGNWVFGPELGIEGGSVDASDTVALVGEPIEIESSVNHIVTLVMKTGYTVNPQTLVYGTFGVARGDFDYSASIGGSTETVGYTSSGIAAGLGVERMFSPSTSVFAEYQYRDFGRETVTFADELDTVATPAHSNVKLGVNFRF